MNWFGFLSWFKILGTILDIVRRVQKTPSPNLAQIFVQLSPLIDVVSAIQKKTTKLQNIIDRQAPVFESPAKTKVKINARNHFQGFLGHQQTYH